MAEVETGGGAECHRRGLLSGRILIPTATRTELMDIRTADTRTGPILTAVMAIPMVHTDIPTAVMEIRTVFTVIRMAHTDIQMVAMDILPDRLAVLITLPNSSM